MSNQGYSARRNFLGGATAVTTALAARLARAATEGKVKAADPIRIGLVGCGGRGTGAATNALLADSGVRLVAVADAFPERIESSLAALARTEGVGDRVDVPAARRFVGFDGFEHVIAADVDVVLLCTPPHFRPQQMRAAVAAGKHVFAEKPVAVDAPGVRMVLAAAEEARRKKLSVVSGLCWRYDAASRRMMERLHAGAIGDLRHVHVSDFRGPIWVKPRQPGWDDMEYQMRNWYYFSWLSGDFIVEQHVHLLDVVAWMLKDEYPVRAFGIGGRSWRNGPEFGNIYDHHAVTYEYASGVKVVSHSRQYPVAHNGTAVSVMGSKGMAEWAEKRTRIVARKTWEPAAQNDKFQAEHDELFASIRRGKPLNNGDYMAKSTLMGIMGREATYSGQLVKWEELSASTDSLAPAQYAWGTLPVRAVAVPGGRGKG